MKHSTLFGLSGLALLALLQGCGSGTNLTALNTNGSVINPNSLVPAGSQLYTETCLPPEGLPTVDIGNGQAIADVDHAFDPVAACETDAVNQIYLGDPTVVSFDDFVLVFATSQLPISQRSAENIVDTANTLFSTRPEGPFEVGDLDPVPNSDNTNFVAGPPISPDLLDATAVYAAQFLPASLRTAANLVAVINQLLGTSLTEDDILAIPGIELPGGVAIDPAVDELAGQIQISVLDPEGTLTLPGDFEIGAALFIQNPVNPFDGFVTYVADLDSALVPVNFTAVAIDGTDDDTCIIVSESGEDNPLLATLATSSACPTVITDTSLSGTPADIADSVTAYQAALGGANNAGEPQTFPDGFRTINWDASPLLDDREIPNFIPGDTFNADAAPLARGLVFTEPGEAGALDEDLFRISRAMPPLLFSDVNGEIYMNEASFFSPNRIFAYNDPDLGVAFDVIFFLPSDQVTPASVNGFGVIFTDVDTPTSSMEYLDADGNTLLVAPVPALGPSQGSLSFLGVVFPEGSPVARVRITAGDLSVTGAPADGGVEGQDVVAMDDFLYGEPQPIE